jgi:protein TonB
VQAEIVIDREGAVADARIVKSIPLLDEAALKAVREWRFAPTLINGRPVPLRMVVTVSFSQ